MASSTSNNPATWSDLPDSLLYSILTLLPSTRDLLAFSSVCRSWRSLASSTVSPSPTSFFPPLLLHILYVRRPRRRHRLVPSGLLLIDPSSPRPISTLNRSLIEAQSILTLPFLSSSHGHLLFKCRRDQILIVNFITGHLHLSPRCPHNSFPFGLAYLTAPLSTPSSSLLLLTHKSLFIWQVSGTEWIHHSFDIEIQFFSEMAVIGSRIYAMDKFNSQIFSINMPPKLTAARHEPNLSANQNPTHRLVDRGGELLSVCFLSDKSPEYSTNLKVTVFQLDFSHKQPEWVKLESLGNWALFVNADRRVAGFSCKNPERWGGKSNCVYYSGLNCKGSWSVWRLGDLIVDSEIVSRLESQFYDFNQKCPDQIWAYPNILSEGFM